MACASCPPSMSRVEPVRTGKEAPRAVDPTEIPTGIRMLPHGESTFLIRVDPARILAGLPAVVVRTGERHRELFRARAIRILGESCLGPVGDGVCLATSAAIEVI